MYLKYVTNATSIQAQVIADLALLASGGTIAACSASCDKVNSAVLANTLAPGWTLVDSAAPLSGAVISAPDIDARMTKYARIYASSAVLIGLDSYETWSVGTHTGTNGSSLSLACLAYSATVVNNYYMVVEPRLILVTASAGTTLIGQLEFSRDAAYLSANYPAFGSVDATLANNNNYAVLYPCRVKNLIAAGDLLSAPAVCTLSSITVPSSFPIRDSIETLYHPLYPVFVTRTNYGIFGRVINAYSTSFGYGSALDEVFDGTDTWVAFGVGRILVKKA